MRAHILPFIIVLFFSNMSMKAQSFSISVWNSQLCINSTAYAAVTSTAPSAGSYSWTAVGPGPSQASINSASAGLSAMLTYTSCGVFTVSCFAYSAVTPTLQVGQISTTVSVSCNSASTPTIFNSAPNASICSGSSATLTGFGGLTYTWIPGNLAGSSIAVSPASSTCYTLLATNAIGCMGMATSCMSVLPTYSLSVNGNTQVCLGSSTTLSLSGGPSFLIQPGNLVTPNPLLTPTVSTIYTLTCPSVAYACATSSVVFVNVINPPVMGISGSPSLCAGASSTLFALGGLPSYTWSTGSTNSSIVVSPLSNTCYSLAGTGQATAPTWLCIASPCYRFQQ